MNLRALWAQYGLPAFEQWRLSSLALQQPRSWVLAHDTDELTAAQLGALHALFARRSAGEPMAYIEGHREFYGLTLQVSPDTLIPRAETEQLVDYARQYCPQGARVLELATGSGAIAVALKHHRADLHITATDLSAAALQVAQANAAAHSADIHWRCGDWFSALSAADLAAPFDCIIANPPYIAAGDAHLSQGDLRFEPRSALTDEADGLQHLRHIISHAPQHLRGGAWLLLEHGFDQAAAVAGLMQAAGFTQVQTLFDASAHGQPGHARATVAYQNK